MSVTLQIDVEPLDQRNLNAILQQEERRQRALETNDLDCLTSVYDADAVVIHSFGLVQNGCSFINAIRQSVLRYKRTDIEIFRVIRLGPKSMLVSGGAITNGVFYDEPRTFDDLFVMSWSKQRDAWKLVSFQSTSALGEHPTDNQTE